MSLRKTPLVFGEFYHIYNRGNNKQIIFHDQKDYGRFIKLLFLGNGEVNFKVDWVRNTTYDFNRGNPLVNIGAYCLMPNHFYILLSQTKDGSISKFMQKVTTGYSMYYNKRYQRTGTLFEGKFKSVHVNTDAYLKYIFSYIHLNPVKIIDPNWKEDGIKNKGEAIKFLNNYHFSSYNDYANSERPQAKIINKKTFPDYFYTKTVFKKEIFDWLDYHSS